MPSLPAIANLISEVVSYGLQFLNNRDNASKGDVWRIGSYLCGQVVNELYALGTTMGYWSFTLDHYMWGTAYKAKAEAARLGAAQSNTNNAVKHVTDVYIPNSLQYLVGFVSSKKLGPIHAQIAQLKGYVGKPVGGDKRNLFSWVYNLNGQLDNWRKFGGALLNLLGWMGSPSGGYPALTANEHGYQLIKLVSDWYDDPGNMVDVFLGRRGNPDGSQSSGWFNWFVSDSHTGGRDQMLATLADYSPEVYRHVVYAAVQMLNSDWP